jgi:hypothetical protein
MMKAILVFLTAMAASNPCSATDWKLKKEQDNIRVYTATEGDSKYRSVKVECSVKARFAQIVAALLDIDRLHEWIYSDKYSKLLKQPGSNEVIFYSEVSVPWPCANRDFVADCRVTQTRPDVVLIDSHSESGYMPEKEGVIRVKSSSAHWILTAIGNNEVKIEYTVQFDPGGSVPAWLTNMFVAEGPLKTFEKLRERVNIPAYQDAHYDFITE